MAKNNSTSTSPNTGDNTAEENTSPNTGDNTAEGNPPPNNDGNAAEGNPPPNTGDNTAEGNTPPMSDELKELVKKVANKKLLEAVEIIAEHILEKKNKKDINSTMSSKEIYNEYRIYYDGDYNNTIPDILDTTFVIYLNKNSKEINSRINCPGRRQGYYLDDLFSNDDGSDNDNNQRKFKEEDLYPIIQNWLFEKEFDRVGNVSNIKSNGKWGNPDLVALDIEELLGVTNVQITTVEVKQTIHKWDEWIFEAIAHTRFADRSYFAFLHPEDMYSKLDSLDIKLYAEHFNIGVIVIECTRKTYDSLFIKNTQKNIREEDITRITEYCQAPHTKTNIVLRKKYLESINIKTIHDLYSFGSGIK